MGLTATSHFLISCASGWEEVGELGPGRGEVSGEGVFNIQLFITVLL